MHGLSNTERNSCDGKKAGMNPRIIVDDIYKFAESLMPSKRKRPPTEESENKCGTLRDQTQSQYVFDLYSCPKWNH
jgi:hypothetical protein